MSAENPDQKNYVYVVLFFPESTFPGDFAGDIPANGDFMFWALPNKQ